MNYKVLHDEPMSQHTTFRTGGNAKDYYIIENADGLKELMESFDAQGIKPIVIGNGSNLLVSDKGLDVPVVDISSGYNDISVDGKSKNANYDGPNKIFFRDFHNAIIILSIVKYANN